MLGPDRPDCDVVAVVVSELVTNSVCHAQTDFVVAISVGASVYVEVRDGSWLPPRRTPTPDPGGETGRGLVLVNALADAWGYQLTAEGKTVWFETGGNYS